MSGGQVQLGGCGLTPGARRSESLPSPPDGLAPMRSGDVGLLVAPRVIDLTRSAEVGARNCPSASEAGMAVDVRASHGPERTRALLEEIAGGRRGAQLRGQVAARNRGATREHVEEAFQEACLKAGRSCRGQTMGEVYKWLLKTTDSTVRDMRERLKHEVLIDQSATEFQKPDPSLAPPDEVLIKREEHAELSHLTISILKRLGDRERKVAVLHSHGLARKEIARHLGTTSRIVKRDIEGILATGRAQLTKVTGRGCPDGDSLVARYAFGLATEREARRAQLHLATCTRCGSMFERLDLWRERVAALLPVPPAVDAQTHLAERIAHVCSDALVSGNAQARPAGLRQHAGHAMANLRDQAASTYYRTVDPTPLAGVRPGAVAAAVAGCLAVGSSATYCVQQSADPIAAFTGLARTSHHEHKSKPHAKRARAAQDATPPAMTPIVTASPPAQAQTQTVAVPQPQAATATSSEPPPAPEDQFEPTSTSTAEAQAAASTSAAAAQAAASKSQRPAPATEGGPGEFDGP